MIGGIYPGGYYPTMPRGVVFDTLFVTVESKRWNAVDVGGRWVASDSQHFAAAESKRWQVVYHGRGDI